MYLLKIIIQIVLCVSTGLSNTNYVENSNIHLVVNGERLNMSMPAVINNGHALLPAREVFDRLGFVIQWDGSTGTVFISRQKNTIELKINSNMARINKKVVNLGIPPVILSGHTYIPLRPICEATGILLRWDGNINTIFIDTPSSKKPMNTQKKSMSTPKKSMLTPIISQPSATLKQAQEWAKKKGATDTFIELAPFYWELCQESGVDPAVAYAQAAKETGYGKFGGVVSKSFCNPCGLKTRKNGSDLDPNAHMKFSDWRTGVIAHIDHLALYAGAKGYPKKNTPDPKHHQYLFGKAKNVEDLSGKWAPSSIYGKSIVKDFLNKIRNIS